MYIFDFLLFIRRNLPYFLRKPAMIAWLNVLFTPLVSLWAELVNYYTQLIDSLAVTSQTNILQAALRVLYPTTINGFDCQIITVYDDRPQAYSGFRNEHQLVGRWFRRAPTHFTAALM